MDSRSFIPEEYCEMILEMGRALNSQLELDKLLDMVLEKAMAVVQAEAGTLWLVEDDGSLVPVVVRGPKAGVMKNLCLRPGEGLVGQVVAANEPCLVKDVRRDPAWAGWFDDITGFTTVSLLCIPLRAREDVIGCLQLVNKRGRGHFTFTDLELASVFAGQAAIALENSRLYTWQKMLLDSLIRALTSALDARDPHTRGHSERVARYALLAGRELGFSASELETLERAALLHDIGKIGVRDSVLLQKGFLSEEEWQIMKTHPEIGSRILTDVEPRHLAGKLYEGALYHQEKYDGQGYPGGVKGKEIPLVARIIAVADAFDAITSDRPYRERKTFPQALAEIKRCVGTQFDPEVVRAFTRAAEKEFRVSSSEF